MIFLIFQVTDMSYSKSQMHIFSILQGIIRLEAIKTAVSFYSQKDVLIWKARLLSDESKEGFGVDLYRSSGS